MLLQRSLGEISLPDGRPLVAGTQDILPHRLSQPPDELPQWSLTAMAIGLALAGLFAGARRKPALQSTLMLAFWLLSGLLGSVMLAMWLGTEHVYGHGNENLLLFSPLAWLAFGLHFARNRNERWHKAYALTVSALAAMAVLAVIIKLMPFSTQQNLNWILMTLPLHWLIARRIRLPGEQK
jgi:FtsH-binding integral membrane protein